MADPSSARRAAVSPRGGSQRSPSVLPLLAAAVLAAGVLVACASAGPGPQVPMDAATAPAPLPGRPGSTGPMGRDTLLQPMEITSGPDHVLNVTLAAVFQDLWVPDTTAAGGKTLNLRTYQVINANGIDYADSARYGFPGPTLRAYPGDSIHLVLQNRLLQPPGTNAPCMPYPAVTSGVDTYEDCFHGENWTNIHYHGMHVTPAANGDDVLKLIAPDSTYTYGFRIPANQSPGTHWYHPHKHGSVAIQVMNGMSGALIVDGGPLDQLADQHGMTERLISLQQIMQSPNLIGPFSAQFTLANGQVAPVIVMRPGEVQRWRLVDENVTKSTAYRIAIEDLPGADPVMYDVARDGVTYADTNYAPGGVLQRDTAVLMAPGNRLDVFVQAPADVSGNGLFRVRATPILHDRPNDLTRKADLRDDQDPATINVDALPVFFVMVDESLPPNGSTLPASLPPQQSFLANLPGPLDPRSIDMSRVPVIVFADSNFVPSRSPSAPAQFYLGTEQNPYMKFDSDSVYVPRTAANVSMPMVLDSVQTWQVVNRSPATNHPFHIHINPFQVIDVTYPDSADPNIPLYMQLDSAAQQRGTPIWLDVLPLPLPRIDTLASGVVDTVPGTVLIRQAYQPFLNADGSTCTSCGPAYGQFVMHCHILGHEERGMMQVLQIYENAEAAAQAAALGHPSGGHGGHAAHEAAAAAAARGSGAGNGRGSGRGNGTGGGNGQNRPHQH